MAGDKIDIFGRSYYSQAVSNNGTCTGCALTAANLVAAFLNAPGAIATTGVHGAVSPALLESQAGGSITSILQSSQNTQAQNNTNRPRAFINYILFDEQFKYAGGGASMVGDAYSFKQHLSDLQDISITKNGYIYVYCSNESNINVFFDNLQVVHSKGAILEETHYYPFGLTMAGISYRAFGSLINNKKFNSYELNNDFDLNLNESFYRLHDCQIGRFLQIDPKPSHDISQFTSMNNNPALVFDILGDIGIIGSLTDATVKANGKSYNKNDLVNGLIKDWKKITGLKLRIDKSGKLINDGVATNKGISLTARKEVMDLIKNPGSVHIDFSSLESQGLSPSNPNASSVKLNPADIESQINGTSKDLNQMTFGVGMTVLHELGHTLLHNNFEHGDDVMKSFGKIDETDVRTNKMRSELGKDWGQRLSYTSVSYLGGAYIPMSTDALRKINDALPLLQRAETITNPIKQGAALMEIKMPTSGVVIIK